MIIENETRKTTVYTQNGFTLTTTKDKQMDLGYYVITDSESHILECGECDWFDFPAMIWKTLDWFTVGRNA